MSTPSIAQRVAAGVQWLDKQTPLWWRRVDLERLDLESSCNCVLGQEFGKYYDAPDGVSGIQSAPLLGFNRLDDLDVTYEELTAEWVRVIQERRTQAGASS